MRFRADTQTTLTCSGSVSPRAMPQLPYLLTMSRHHDDPPSQFETDWKQQATPTHSPPLLLKSHRGIVPQSDPFPRFVQPLTATSLASAQAQLLELFQSKVGAASQHVTEVSHNEQEKKKQKKVPNNCWCRSFWVSAQEEEEPYSSVTQLDDYTK